MEQVLKEWEREIAAQREEWGYKKRRKDVSKGGVVIQFKLSGTFTSPPFSTSTLGTVDVMFLQLCAIVNIQHRIKYT